MIDRIVFVIGETLIGLRRNWLLGVAAMTTAAIALYILAGMAYVGAQASSYAESLQSRFEMTINLKEGTTVEGIQRTAKYLRATPGVANVVLIPREKRWERDRKRFPELTEGYGFTESPYPDALRVRLNDLEKTEAVADKARRMSTVDRKNGVLYFGEAQKVVARWISVGRTLSYWVGGLLLAVAGIVIGNAVWLTVASRATEVRIMRLVGASRIVIALPFCLEGVFQGALGGALATWGLVSTHRAVESLLRERALPFTLAPIPVVFVLMLLCGAGGGYGGVCSLAALRTSLRRPRQR